MSARGVDWSGIAERFLAAFDRDAPIARTAADVRADKGTLERLLDRTLVQVTDAQALADPGARRELSALDPARGAALERIFRSDFGGEARIRSALSAATVEFEGGRLPVWAAMKRYRSEDQAVRQAIRAVLDKELDRIAETTRAAEWSVPAPAPALSSTPPPPPPRSAPGAGGIVLATADMIAALTGPAPLDVKTGTQLVLEAARPASPAPEAAAPSVVPASAPSSALADLVRGLAERVSGSVPETWGGWRAAAAGAGVADFRPSRGVALTALASRAEALPFEQPLVPMARRGAIVAPGVDAASSSAYLLGLGVFAGDLAVGAALALTAPSRIFLARGLEDRPSDRDRAQAALALAVLSAYLEASIGARADGSGEALRDLAQDVFGTAPPAALAGWWSLEVRAAAAAGESRAIYRWGGTPTAVALLRGASVARALREAFDEDWFRNPRAEVERIGEVARAHGEPGSESSLIDWVREALNG